MASPREAETLTDTLRQTEDVMSSVNNLIAKMRVKLLQGDVPVCNVDECKESARPSYGICEQAEINLKCAHGLYSELSALVDRL